MKNNRLTNGELQSIQEAATEIKRLARMETCSFKDMDMIPRDKLKLWLKWFSSNANTIISIVGEDCPDIDQHNPGKYARLDEALSEEMLKQAQEWMEER